MKEFYILSKDGEKAVRYDGLDQWKKVCDDPNRVVADQDIEDTDYNVCTYFVGQGPYCIWETMVCQVKGKPRIGDWVWAHEMCMGDRDDAMEMHKDMVEKVILDKRPERVTIKVRINPETGLFE